MAVQEALARRQRDSQPEPRGCVESSVAVPSLTETSRHRFQIDAKEHPHLAWSETPQKWSPLTGLAQLLPLARLDSQGL